MTILADILVGFVSIIHFCFLILEMFLWEKPLGLRIFSHTRESASASKILAMNQGLYNGFLSAGLAWGLYLGDAGYTIKIFFLGCVVIAGIFGGLTASRSILVLQAFPAAIALAVVIFS